MSIWDRNFYEDGTLTEDQLKEELINFFFSHEHIYEIKKELSRPLKKIKVEEYINNFIEYIKLPININDLKKFSLNELIEIFLTSLTILEKGQKQISSFKLYKTVFEKLLNRVDYYLKHKNIKKINIEGKISLSFENDLIIQKIENEELKNLYSQFCVLKNNRSEEGLYEKKKILSAFKNSLDFYMKNKTETDIEESRFVVLHNDKLRTYWQSLASHFGSETKNKKFEEIKKEFKDSKLEEKHKLFDEMFDAIVFVMYKRGS